MKTKSTNPTKIGEKTNTRNFFQKTFILFAILAFTGFTTKSYGQPPFDIDVYNNGGCTMTITAFDASSNVLYTGTHGAGLTNSGCITPFPIGAIVNTIVISRPFCSPITFTATTTTSGTITYSLVGASCGGCSYTSMTCAGGGGGSQCTGSGSSDFHYLVEILL